MKHVFKVLIHFRDGTTDDYYIVAENDLEAREKAIKIDLETWKRPSSGDYVDYCIITEGLMRIDG